MRIAGMVQDSIVDGPGLRFTLFVQGCPHRCEGCHNPDTHDFSGGHEVTTDEVIEKLLSNPLTDGITFSGGEPFEQAADCALIAAAAKENSLNVWTYSGYTFEELLEKSETSPAILEFLRLTDVLVDGRFILSEKSLMLKWRGSANQRVLNAAESLVSGTAIEYEEKNRYDIF